MNMNMIRKACFALGCAVIASGFVGCSSALRSAPNAAPVMDLGLERSDYTILDDVEERSEMLSVCGVFHMIDEDENKQIILGFRTFEDQYVMDDDGIFAAIGRLFAGGSPSERANYKALTAAEAVGADMVIPKRVQVTEHGFPPFYSIKTATVKGKAIKVKADKSNLGN